MKLLFILLFFLKKICVIKRKKKVFEDSNRHKIIKKTKKDSHKHYITLVHSEILRVLF